MTIEQEYKRVARQNREHVKSKMELAAKLREEARVNHRRRHEKCRDRSTNPAEDA